MPKESVDEWCLRIAKSGGGRSSAYLEAFEDEDDEDYDAEEEARAYERQEAAKKKRLLKEQLDARRALDERKRGLDEQALQEKQEWVRQLRAYIDQHVYAKNSLIKRMLGTLPKTPIADEYYEVSPATLSREGFELARKELKDESQRLDPDFARAQGEHARRSARELLSLEIQGVYDARTDLEALARGLELDLGGRARYTDPRTATLTDPEVATLRQQVADEMAEIEQRRALLARKTWAPDELTEFGDAAQAARDDLVAALQARGPLPGGASGWVDVLNRHARLRARAISHAELLESLDEFFDANPDVRPVRDVFKEFATQYGYEPDQWQEYQKAWKSHVRKPETGGGPRNGVLALARLNALRGGTAGQRYTKDESFMDGATEYAYHLSVSFSTRGAHGDTATITGLHVSFKAGSTDRKYWYRIEAGTVAYRETSGGAVAESAMHRRANALVRKKAKSLNYNFT